MCARISKSQGSLLALGFLLSVLSSCKLYEPVRVGFVAGLTGPNAALGVDGRDGVEVAIDKVNAEGGVNGHPLELVVRNNQGTPGGAIGAARELINDEGVFVIINPVTSSMMMAAWGETKDSDVIFFSPTVSTSQLTGMDDNFFRVTPTTTAFAENLADHATDDLGLKRLAIFYDVDNADFSDVYREEFTESIISNGSEVVWKYGFSSASAPDFTPVLESLIELHPDGVLVIASAVDTALIAQQIRLRDDKVQLLTSNWALTKDLIENGGTAVDGIVAVAAYDEDSQSQEYLDFINRFQERFGRMPSFSSGHGYETMLILADALKKTNGNREGLKEALLETSDFSGVFGNISFDEYGDVRRTLYLVAVRDGEFVTEKSFPVP
jgi:branched-chain amino acid transport system substrate-binding protein